MTRESKIGSLRRARRSQRLTGLLTYEKRHCPLVVGAVVIFAAVCALTIWRRPKNPVYLGAGAGRSDARARNSNKNDPNLVRAGVSWSRVSGLPVRPGHSTS